MKTDTAGWKTVAYGNFAPYLVEAIKAQDRVVTALQAQMAEWEARDSESPAAAQYATKLAEMKVQITNLQMSIEELVKEQNRRYKVLEQQQIAAIARLIRCESDSSINQRQDAQIAALRATIDGLIAEE